MPLVTTKQLFDYANKNKIAICAFNINNMELIQGVVEAADELNTPVILQVSKGARNYANPVYLRKLVEAAAETTKINFALHLDHGEDFEICKQSIDGGFTSVMIDGSHLPFEENVKLTKQIVDYAHKRGVNVEGELGQLSGIEDDKNVSTEDSHYTNPSQVAEFIARTGVDSLAIAIGTSHGAYKHKTKKEAESLRLDILKQINQLVPDFPLVLHGASSVTKSDVETINKNGGNIANALGTPENLLKQTIPLGVRKINIDSDLRLAFTAKVREYLKQNPSHFDPRQYLKPAREHVKQLVKRKIEMFSK